MSGSAFSALPETEILAILLIPLWAANVRDKIGKVKEKYVVNSKNSKGITVASYNVEKQVFCICTSFTFQNYDL